MPAGKITITGRNLDLTAALKSYVVKRAEKLFEHNDKIIRAEFKLVVEDTKDPQHSFTAKARLEIPGKDVIVSITSDDLYKSIDTLQEKLVREIRRAHRLVKEKRNHPNATDVGGDIPKSK